MTSRKLINTIHLWLGLISGLIIFIICITAAIWAFSPEIENLLQPYRTVQQQPVAFLSVSTLQKIADNALPNRVSERIDFEGSGKAAIINLSGKGNYKLYINPYNGKILKICNENNAFFHLIKKGHTSLWLGNTGEEIVKWASVIFFFILISGIVLWWPKNKAALKQRFTIKKNSSFIRLNYDLHNVLGFYASWIIVFAVLTAIVWGFDCISDAEQWIGNAGKKQPDISSYISTPNNQHSTDRNEMDSIFNHIICKYKTYRTALIIFPEDDSDVINIVVYPFQNAYRYDDYYFDQYSLKEITLPKDRYINLSGGEKLSRMNYDIHIGRIAGLPGRTVMFFSSLIGASLPVTGFIIWWKRKKKKKSAK